MTLSNYKWHWPTKQKGVAKSHVTMDLDREFKQAIDDFIKIESLAQGRKVSIATIFTTLTLRHIKEIRDQTKHLKGNHHNEINSINKDIEATTRNI